MPSIAKIILDLSNRKPHDIAVVHEDRQLTFSELHASTNRLARDFRQRGAKPGDFVTIALPNSIGFVEASIAAWKIGATPQPVSARLPNIELAAIIELAAPAILIGAKSDSMDPEACLPIGYTPSKNISDENLTDIVSKSWKAPTSGGSTGRPKIIVAGAAGEFDFSAGEFPLRQMPDRTHLVTGPLYHNAPFSFSANALFTGNMIVIMTRFDAEETLRLIERHHIDWMMMVPTMMLRIWKLPEAVRNSYDLSSLRIMLHLAAPCAQWLKEEWINWLGGDVVNELFGGTEATGATWITGDEWLTHRGSVGKLMPGSSVKVLNENGQEVSNGTIGEIYLRPDNGAGTTYRYIGAESKPNSDGWESLGDMGYVDDEGYIYLSDRKTDMILAGGSNIYPAEVEAAIDAHPAVRSSAVIGLPDEDLGQTVHAIVDAPDEVDESALLSFLTDRLVRYKIPRSVEFVSFPLRDDAGKTRRSALLAERVSNT
ncbi:MAG: bile acid-coenzyme A ligase [Gammaproteobacteria bacterium]|jgi:bile acid-coenzyme A ligase